MPGTDEVCQTFGTFCLLIFFFSSLFSAFYGRIPCIHFQMLYISCKINLVISYVSHLSLPTLVQYQIFSIAMTRTRLWANETTNLQTKFLKFVFGGEQPLQKGSVSKIHICVSNPICGFLYDLVDRFYASYAYYSCWLIDLIYVLKSISCRQ